ncbi:MAG: hypothetical protein IJW65_01980 [Clostridia bacterium]|nr:hypothetical protein [Clostridia bacterium]
MEKKILLSKLLDAKKTKKSELIFLIILFVFMFTNIFILMWLTGMRDMSDFSNRDWIFASIMGAFELLTVVLLFITADSFGKNNVLIASLSNELRQITIEQSPLLSGNPIRVYTDDNYTARMTIFFIPSTLDFYYCVESFDTQTFELHKTYTSEFFQDIDELSGGLDALENISDLFNL